jgi:polyhydroxybutyrate depolymerase
VLIIHGTADQNLPYNGGVGTKALARHQVRPVSYAVNTWRALDGCPDSAATTTAGTVTHSVWAPCRHGTAVELYTIQGGGHAWPGGRRMAGFLDEPSNALDATEVAWEFFVAHPRR